MTTQTYIQRYGKESLLSLYGCVRRLERAKPGAFILHDWNEETMQMFARIASKRNLKFECAVRNGISTIERTE